MVSPDKDIESNFRRLRERVARAAAGAGREPSDVAIVVVTKNRSEGEIRAVVAAGARLLGENRVQEAAAKIPNLADLSCEWHLIGHLQTNKVGKAVGLFDCVQSLDSERLARALDRRAAEAGKLMRVLIEVNTSGEVAKFGVEPEAAPALYEVAAALPYIRVEGLMTVGPLTTDTAKIAAAFAKLRTLFEEISRYAARDFKCLSMGMTDDYEIAIAEGSNMIRVGRAVFEGG